jgi:2-keto-4-pentenoate hydratase/2-oxohepta-3-ene-1,7-dioic acid hydratase in catechol pathway
VRLVSFRSTAAFGAEPGRTALLGVVDGDWVVPGASIGAAATMDELLRGGPEALAALRDALAAAAPDAVRVGLDEIELLAPIPRPGKIAAAGVNYRSHGEEQNREPPDHPVLFAKFTTSVVGHGAEIRWSPAFTQAVDFEAELAVVIGRRCRRIAPEQAPEHVAGYTCLNDVSARDLQYSDRQFVRAKSLDTFCPMGPWLVTADEVGDPQSLSIRCLVNGEVMQSATTADMVFSVAELVSFCSQAFTLEPGDIIATGTPSGVGWFREPRRMLRDGDVVEVDIERIGTLRNTCREEIG